MPDNVVFLRRDKAVCDTSVYVSYLRSGRHADRMTELLRSHVLFLSSVVFEELIAGVSGEKENRELVKLKKIFLASARILTPTYADWQESGRIVNALWRNSQFTPRQAVGFTHDVLIAVSARREGL